MFLIGINTSMGCLMRDAHVIISCLLAALALSGWMRTSGPVAAAQPQSDLDSFAYGQAYGMAPAPTAMAYAAVPTPVRSDTAYRLDAGDKLRVVVYGQEGLTTLGPGDTVLVGERWF
jgi:polysaccharide biosynthesis/export protein